MSKSLCIISPQSLTAGERTKLTFTYITDTVIPMGSEITFHFSPGHSKKHYWSKPREFMDPSETMWFHVNRWF